MDRKLHQARENFATIFQASPAILCIVQLSTLRYCEVNRAYERHTGYSRSEVLGKTCLDLGLWNNAEDRDHMFQQLLTKGRLFGRQKIFQTKSGDKARSLIANGKLMATALRTPVRTHEMQKEVAIRPGPWNWALEYCYS